jgi:hypothetical protein
LQSSVTLSSIQSQALPIVPLMVGSLIAFACPVATSAIQSAMPLSPVMVKA